MTESERIDQLHRKLVDVFGLDEAETIVDLLCIPGRPTGASGAALVDPWVRYRRLYERSVEVLGREEAGIFMALLRIPGVAYSGA